MRLGVEVLARAPTLLRLGHFFESWLALPSGVLRRSLGRDEYHLGVTIGRDRRLAATGRTYICQIDAEEAGLGVNQARSAALTPVEIPPGSPLFLGLRTNVFLQLPDLMAGVRLQIVRSHQPPVEFFLTEQVAEQVLPGRYVVDLTTALGAGDAAAGEEPEGAPSR